MAIKPTAKKVRKPTPKKAGKPTLVAKKDEYYVQGAIHHGAMTHSSNRLARENFKKAIDIDKEYAIAEKINDVAAMSADLQVKGNILLEMGKYAEAREQFDKLLKMTEGSGLSQEIKDNTRLFHHYNLATVALGMKDGAKAVAEAEEFRKGAEASKNPAQVRQAHQLLGMIALAEKDYDKAIAELQQTGQQNPQNFFRLCQAYQAKGDNAKAREFCQKAADFNSLPALNYAFVRTKARKMATEIKG